MRLMVASKGSRNYEATSLAPALSKGATASWPWTASAQPGDLDSIAEYGTPDFNGLAARRRRSNPALESSGSDPFSSSP